MDNSGTAQARIVSVRPANPLKRNGRPYRELHPAVLMVQPAENRPSGDLADTLDRPMAWRILDQGQVCSQFVVVGGVARKNPPQMLQ